MKRDMDLIRDLLIKIEEAPEPTNSSALTAEVSPDEARRIIDHLRLLQDGGLIDCISSNPISGSWRCQNIKLTWEGHDFLDTVRDPEVWQRTKEGASKMGGWTFDLLKDMGKAYLKHVAKERLGLDL